MTFDALDKLSNLHPNLSVLDEYSKAHEVHTLRQSELDTVTMGRDAVKLEHDELCRLRLKSFLIGFHCISAKLKEMYQVRVNRPCHLIIVR